MANILIGCRLPNGLILRHPDPARKGATVKLRGANEAQVKSVVIGETFVTTPVDADFWETWKKVYSDYEPLKKGAIFEARNEPEANGKGRELTKEKTGFEAMAKDALGVKEAKE
jgi:hypothetical protein